MTNHGAAHPALEKVQTGRRVGLCPWTQTVFPYGERFLVLNLLQNQLFRIDLNPTNPGS